jgi:hypothetical protein
LGINGIPTNGNVKQKPSQIARPGGIGLDRAHSNNTTID